MILNSSSFGKHFQEHRTRLETFADLRSVQVLSSSTAAELVPLLQDADGIIASVTPRLDRETLSALPSLVLVARHGIGCDNVDLEAAADLGIQVSRVAGLVEREAVAEHAVALLLCVARHLKQGADAIENDAWSERSQYIGLEIRNKTVGVLGLGVIGTRFSEILSQGFRAKVLAQDPNLSAEEIQRKGAIPASLDEVLESADIISLHCPLTEQTRRLFNRERLARCKPGVILINTCRGELFDEVALLEALRSGQVRGYGTDVVEGEPIDSTHALIAEPNAVVVPHLGGYTHESLKGMGQTMVEDCERVFLRSETVGTIANPRVLQGEYRRWR